MVVAVMSIFKKKRCELRSANLGNERPSCQKVERADFLLENTQGLRSLSQKSRKGRIPKKLASKSKKLELNCTNLMLNSKKTRSDCAKTPNPSVSSGLYVKNKTIRVLLDSGSSGDLLFMKKGSSKCITIVKRVVPQSWGTSNDTFITDKVGNIEISFVEYLASMKVCLQPDIVEYSPGDQAPMYDLIIDRQTMHNLGVKLDCQEKTITIDKILLPMRNLAANVADMLATCCNDTRFRSHFGQMGRCCQHKIEDAGTFCVSLSQHPYFPAKNQTSLSAYVEIYYGMGVTYAQIRTLMLYLLEPEKVACDQAI